MAKTYPDTGSGNTAPSGDSWIASDALSPDNPPGWTGAGDPATPVNPLIQSFIAGTLDLESLTKEQRQQFFTDLKAFALTMDPAAAQVIFPGITDIAAATGRDLYKAKVATTTAETSPLDTASFIVDLNAWGVEIDDQLKEILSHDEYTTGEMTLAIQGSDAYKERFKGKPPQMSELTFLDRRTAAYGKPSTRALMDSWGLGHSEKLREIASLAEKKGWSQDQITRALSRTKEYKQRFRGKPADMKESEYLTTEQSYHAIAAQIGISLGPTGITGGDRLGGPGQDARIGWLMKNRVSPEEFRTKGEALVSIRDNADLFAAFSKEAAARTGTAPSKEDLLRFVMGTGDAKWHQIWDQSQARYAAQQAGIDIGRSGIFSVSAKQLHEVGTKGLSPEGLSAAFQEYGATAAEAAAASEYARFGISQEDRFDAAFGGKNQAETLASMDRARKTRDAFGTEQARQSVGQGGGGFEIGGSEDADQQQSI